MAKPAREKVAEINARKVALLDRGFVGIRQPPVDPAWVDRQRHRERAESLQRAR